MMSMRTRKKTVSLGVLNNSEHRTGDAVNVWTFEHSPRIRVHVLPGCAILSELTRCCVATFIYCKSRQVMVRTRLPENEQEEKEQTVDSDRL